LSNISHVLPISGNGRCYGVLPIPTARVPVLKVTDQGTGVECDISIENKDGMSRSMIIKFISSIDERFRIICYLVLQFFVLLSWF
jgi:DNA polymerase sigma